MCARTVLSIVELLVALSGSQKLARPLIRPQPRSDCPPDPTVESSRLSVTVISVEGGIIDKHTDQIAAAQLLALVTKIGADRERSSSNAKSDSGDPSSTSAIVVRQRLKARITGSDPHTRRLWARSWKKVRRSSWLPRPSAAP